MFSISLILFYNYVTELQYSAFPYTDILKVEFTD